MTFIAIDAENNKQEIRADETLLDLKNALPEGHHLIEKVELCFNEFRGVIEGYMEDAEKRDRMPDFLSHSRSMLDIIDDWKRGIASWHEVETRLKDAHDMVEEAEEVNNG